jgi:predicted RND superfamily exporter protein
VRRLIDLPLDSPRLTLALLIAITVLFAIPATQIRVDSAIETLLPADDDDRRYYRQTRATFGSEEATVIAIFAPDVFAPNVLSRIDRLSNRLAEIEGVREVVSLTTVRGVESDEYGVSVGKLLRELPKTPEEASGFRERVFKSPLYVGNLVSERGDATLALVLFDELTDTQMLELDVQSRIDAALSEDWTEEEYAVTGLQELKVSGAKLMEADLQRFLPVSVAVVVAVLAWAYGTWRGVLLPLAAVGMGLVWTVGIMVLSGSAINMGTLVLPPLVITIGIADSIQVMSRYYQELAPGKSREEVVRATMADVRLPLAIAGVTTVLGSATLTWSPIPAIRDLGIYSLIGISAVSFLALTLLPAALLVLPDAPLLKPHGHRVIGLLEALGRFAIRRRGAVLVGTVVLCALSGWAALSLRVETDYVGFFDPAGEVRRDAERVASALGGAYPLYVVVDGVGPRAVRDLEALAAVRDLQSFIEEQPGVVTTLSLVNYLQIVRRALDPEARGSIPESQTELDQLLTFVAPEDVRPVVSPDYLRANILVRADVSGSTAVSDLVTKIEDYARRRLPRGLEAHVTGTLVLLNRTADTLARGQVWSLVQMVLMLGAVMWLLFLSLRIGILALIPNVVPIILLFGLMAVVGIDLNVSTSMIAVLALGIAVDDTIHYLSALNTEVRRTGSQEQALMEVGRGVGQPILITSIALAAGFLVPCLSSFRPVRDFGFLSSATMLIAIFCELLLVPALVMSTRIITIWDLLYLKLGPDPHLQVPLFAGLRPLQARIVVLMAHLERCPGGTFLTRRGELREELYVLLRGRVEVRVDQEGPAIRALGRGDVLGEMGLVRHQPRSADAVCVNETEYLVLDGDFLQRLLRRYPRIAAKLFLNLTRILSDRLESATHSAGPPGPAVPRLPPGSKAVAGDGGIG